MLKDNSTNTDIPYLHLTSAACSEINRLENKLEEIDTRLNKAEAETKIALDRLKEHDLRTFDILNSYKKLVVDVTLEKESEIETLQSELKTLKQEIKESKYPRLSASV